LHPWPGPASLRRTGPAPGAPTRAHAREALRGDDRVRSQATWTATGPLGCLPPWTTRGLELRSHTRAGPRASPASHPRPPAPARVMCLEWTNRPRHPDRSSRAPIVCVSMWGISLSPTRSSGIASRAPRTRCLVRGCRCRASRRPGDAQASSMAPPLHEYAGTPSRRGQQAAFAS
jgi:hypothetical protein